MYLDESSTNRQLISLGRTETYKNITVSLGIHKPPMFEFLTLFNKLNLNQFEQFGCRVQQTNWVESNLIDVATLTKIPKLTFANNVSQIEVQKPFTVTCSINNFEFNQNYSIKFFNSKDGLLATFEIENNNEPLITSERHENVSVTFGDKFSYPNFDLVVIENNAFVQSYWCSLELLYSSKKLNFNSNHWPIPKIELTTTTTGQITTGRCTISNLNIFNHFYTIKFFSDFGSNLNNLLATYTITPGKPELFVAEPSNLYTSITHGTHRSFPVFEVNVKFAHFSNNWWCALAVGYENQPDYEEFKSNQIQIQSILKY